MIEFMFDLLRWLPKIYSGVRASDSSSYAGGMSRVSNEEHAALIALLQTRPGGMRWAEIVTDVLESGSALTVWHRATPATLMDLPGDDDALTVAAREIAGWVGQGCTMLTVLDDDYPARLRGIHQAPPVLFGHGSLIPGDPAVSVVGSRRASERGLSTAANVARELVSRGLTVLSGLAAGIDTAAHTAALAAGGRTVAIIGTGINRAYPAANRTLQSEIASRGLVLSQFWPDAPPQRHNFPMRNATMSGYGLATVVIEAGEHSGARGQARMAVDHGRPVILTSAVVEQNEWARALLDRPGVHVGHSLRAVMELIDRVIVDREAVGAEIKRLVAN